MQKRLKIGLVTVLIAALLATTAYAIIVIQQEVTTSITILAAYGMEVYDTDGTTLLTSIEFGQYYRGEAFYAPIDNPTTTYYLKNTGEADIWISFSVTDWITDVTIKLGVGTYLLPDVIWGTPIAPGATKEVHFSLIIGSTAPFGSYTPTITFNAHDTATG